MSLLVEIATRADVSLESVVRVLAREPVGEAVKARVLEVLDDLDADETRILQRFALAAVHDILPRPGDQGLVEDSLELPEKVVLELEAGEPAQEAHPAALDAAPLVQLGSVLTELTEAVRELRHETDAERRERVDDLAVLIDLITKGWEGVDRRLARVERGLGRLDGGARAAAIPPRVEPPPVPAPDPPPPPPEGHVVEEVADEPEPKRSTLRRRAPLIAALAVGIAIGALLAIDLPSRFDASAVIGNRSLTAEAARRAQLPQTVAEPADGVETNGTGPNAVETTPVRPGTVPERETTAATATSRPKPPARTAPATTRPPARPAPPAAPRTTTETTTAPPRRTTARPPTTTPAATTTALPPESDFTPSRNWAWPPVAGADYYLVEFFRAGQYLYVARPTVPRLTLPASVRFVPGVYRWRVRAGRGVPGANRLDPPLVDSQFILSR